MRAVSRTTLALGDLLEIPVGIAPATGTEEIKFDTAAPDGAPRKQLYVHPEHVRTLYDLEAMWDAHPGNMDLDNLPEDALNDLAVEVPEPVEDTIKGKRVGDTFRVIPPSEIDYASAATKLDRVELLEVIDYRRVPTDRLAGAFYVQPDPGFERPLATLMAALRRDGNAMLVKWVARSRQRLGVIRVRKTAAGDVLMLNDVTFAAQWREPDDRVLSPGQVEGLDERAIAAACEILAGHHGPGAALATAEDDLPELLTEILERAHDGLYDDPARVLELAAHYGDQELHERATLLKVWAEQRWPELAEKRKEVEQAIAEGGEPGDVGERLAAILG